VPRLEHVIEGIHQAVAEGIGIDIKRRVQEMRDIGPEIPVIVIEPERRAKALALHLHPDVAQALGTQFALRAFGVDAFFELVKGDLPDDGVHHVLDLAGEKDAPPLGAFFGLQHRLKGQHLAEDGRRFGQRQRRVGH